MTALKKSWLLPLLVLIALFSMTACLEESGGASGGGGNNGDDSSDGDADDADGDREDITPPSTNYIIVAADFLSEAAEEYAAYREESGCKTELYTLTELVGSGDADTELLAAIQEKLGAARAELPAEMTLYLLLIGDAPVSWDELDGLIPALDCISNIGDCKTDNKYGDLDGDGIADVAVGRIPARTPDQVLNYLDKVKSHDSAYNVGLFNRRIVLYTGEGGFGEEIDSMLETMVMKSLGALNPAYDIIGAYANPASDYYYTPFDEKVVELISGGSMLTVYIGHGGSSGTEGLDLYNLPQVHCTERLPFFFFFACGNGDYLGPTDCIAEAVVWKPDGHVTSLASSSTSHPYGNAILPYEVQRIVLNYDPATIGEAVMMVKRAAIENTEDELRQLMDSFALIAEISEQEQEELRYQHLNLYNLFGDPAAEMQYPGSEIVFNADGAGSVEDGLITLSGRAPGVADGSAWVTLEAPVEKILYDLEPVDPLNPDEETVQSNWAKAVDKVVVGESVQMTGDTFEAELAFPTGLPDWKYIIKVYADDGENDSFGYMAAP